MAVRSTSDTQFLGAFSAHNYQAEILAVYTAAKYLLECGKPIGNVAIFSDSLSALQTLIAADPDQMNQSLHFSCAKLTAQISRSLQWGPAYVGLQPNIIIIIIKIIAFKGAIRDFLQSPHSAANCQHVRSSGPGTIVCKSCTTHRALITCKCHVTCHLVRRDSSAIKFDRVEIAFI